MCVCVCVCVRCVCCREVGKEMGIQSQGDQPVPATSIDPLARPISIPAFSIDPFHFLIWLASPTIKQ